MLEIVRKRRLFMSRPRRRNVIATLALFVITGSVMAGLKGGIDAIKSNQFELGLKEVQTAAEQGSPLAQRYLGKYHLGFGKVLPINYSEASAWFSRAATAGDTEAQSRLGIVYIKRTDGSADCSKGLALLTQSEEWVAYTTLASVYEHGIECASKDPAQRLVWLKKEAELDSPGAQNDLAIQYWRGEGTPANSNEAFRWFSRAAAQGLGNSMISLGMMHFGDGLPVDEVAGVTWLKLARIAIDKRSDDFAKSQIPRLERQTAVHWNRLSPEERAEVARRVAAFKPHSLWDEYIERKWRKEQEEAERWDKRHAQ